MERFVPYLGAVAAVAFVVSVVLFSVASTEATTSSVTASTTFATTSVAVVPSVEFPSLQLPNVVAPSALETTTEPSTETGTTSAPVQHETAPTVPSTPKEDASSAPAPAPAPVAVPTPTSEPAAPSQNDTLSESAALVRTALVNILCFAPASSRIHSISGSGVIISSKGLVLTNAHVAQYFLLKDQGVSCTLRTGSPARDAYTAELAFISPAWVKDNAGVLVESTPSGTGEHDYAFLAISGSAADAVLPAVFPFIPIAAYPPAQNESVVIASYGAQFLQANQIQSALFPTVVYGSVKNRFTFKQNTADVIALGGSAAAQEGSSGGGVASASGALVGTITTSTISGDTSSRSLDAITTSYIRASYASETGRPLEMLLTESTTTAVADFKSDASALESVILSAIK